MQFTFKRTYDGRIKVYVGDVPIAAQNNHPEGWEWLASIPGVTAEHVSEAAVKADDAGFWDDFWDMENEVTVDVPIADNAVLSVTMEGDEA